MARAASAYWFSRTRRTWSRTSRAMPIDVVLLQNVEGASPGWTGNDGHSGDGQDHGGPDNSGIEKPPQP